MPASARIAAADTRDTAVVLVNLGTPEAPTPQAVRRYLSQFLMDRRVVPLARWLWWPLLHLAILPLRAPVVAKKYASIWLRGEDEGSPLAVYTRRLAQAVQGQLPQYRVLDALRRRRPEPTEPRDLAGELRMSSAHLSAVLDQLEQRTLVHRRPHPDDGRRRLLELAREGAERLDHFAPFIGALEGRMVGAPLSEDEARTLRALLGRVRAALDGVVIPDGRPRPGP